MSTQMIAYNPQAHTLTFTWSYKHPVKRVVFTLVDVTTQAYVTPNNPDGSIVPALTPDNKSTLDGQSGWFTQPYLVGQTGQATFSNLMDISAEDEYAIYEALPEEGGGVGNEPRIHGSVILSLPTTPGGSTIAGVPPASGTAAAQTTSGPAASGPVAAGSAGSNWFSQSTAGIPNWVLALGGALIAVEML